ncbi:cadherin-like beta sandwich domain-containing protein [Clostridium weizhouense]|uniref:Cadherin-like beta sandwich domain-containing protein n=1 Tax=Clostridium weizhouense TaxID=2859781 RepID=A0ABS7APH0_9CLOT|nr:cadherin-like beta sandwich domain-containing protein [Clostridium weizhouense]MBW6410321.1 cadherin-like beta sandwich domain-containing protein [Clostridium weizhouense]
MNKHLKHIIAATLVISAFTAVAPASAINFGTTTAYAKSSKIDKDDIDDFKVNGDSDDLKLYSDSKCKDKTKFKYSTTKYYVKPSKDDKELSINADINDDYEAYVFKDSKKEAHDLGDDIKVSSGSTLYLRIYEKGEFDEDNVKRHAEKTYEIHVYDKSDSKKDDDDDSNDKIYLDDITLSEGTINFSKKTSSYDITVPESVKSVKIKAKPEDEDYTVEIDGHEVNDDDKYRREVDLEKGKNKIKITVEDDDDNKRTYTLNINRADKSLEDKKTENNTNTTKPSNNTNNNSNTPGPSVQLKCNQWVTVNGKWQYNDSNGKAIKSNWYQDRSSGKWYFLDSNGDMVTGWLPSGGAWYYLDGSGAMQKGWLLDGGKWYYLSESGAMKTGWIIDNGKYYYLTQSGAMLTNATINGYKLGSDGAWIRG